MSQSIATETAKADSPIELWPEHFFDAFSSLRLEGALERR